MNRILLTILAFLLLTASARAQESQDEPIQLRTNLVSLAASVRDGGNRPIRSLKAKDFIVYEDGVQQKIEHFAATEEPFTVMLLLDISGSTQDEVTVIKRAARDFLAALGKEDRVGIIVFSGDVEMIAEFTDSRSRAESAIDSIIPPGGKEGFRFGLRTGTSFYDALYLAVEDSPLKQVEGRKAVVCMSDGVDSTSQMNYARLAGVVERSEASVYFLELNTEEAMLTGLLKARTDPGYINFSKSQINRYYDEFDRTSPERSRPREAMQPETKRQIATGLYNLARREIRQMGERTGGRVYAVSALTDLSAIYRQVADELRSQYTLAYYSTNEKRDGRWRAIRVEVRAPGTQVRARPGYWAK